ncbi:MAG: D-alanyl-D-alanine carboxypeptidase/D-alanyl-D-alanine-endopeptidase [Betaproteobacteria bacterium]|nr:D-alanyl-D-alanine carboxypeptidase/D-alanyl-D-alanine-endopeptidase [Betaproteobacteria bacterium]
MADMSVLKGSACRICSLLKKGIMGAAVWRSMRETTQSSPPRQTLVSRRRARGIIGAASSHYYKRSHHPMSKNPRHFVQLPLVIWALMLTAGSSAHATNEAKGNNHLPPVFAQALKKAGVPENVVAVDIRRVLSGETLVAHNNQAIFRPASIMKLVTTQAALELLGPNYRWMTRVHIDGLQRGDVLQGDLIIEGSGDPRFAYEDLWRLLRQLRATGIREIRGALVIDRSLFQRLPDDTPPFDGQANRAYNALPDALLLDAKALQVKLTPETGNARALFSIEPPMADFVVEPPALGQGECGDLRTMLKPELNGRTLRFGGSYPVSCGQKVLSLHLHTLNHVQYFDAVFRLLWAEIGGTITGPTREARVPASAKEILQWSSVTLGQSIRDINKYSNNVMARNLLLSVVAERGGTPATTTAAGAKVLGWLSATGIDTTGIVLDNGSGLSKEERISALTLSRLLQRAWQTSTMPEFMASLPLAGVDGTMSRRLSDRAVKANAHIKTGSLGDVMSIAGYVTTKSGKRVVVVCMVNHPNAGAMRQGFDQLLQWAYDNGD